MVTDSVTVSEAESVLEVVRVGVEENVGEAVDEPDIVTESVTVVDTEPVCDAVIVVVAVAVLETEAPEVGENVCDLVNVADLLVVRDSVAVLLGLEVTLAVVEADDDPENVGDAVDEIEIDVDNVNVTVTVGLPELD